MLAGHVGRRVHLPVAFVQREAEDRGVNVEHRAARPACVDVVRDRGAEHLAQLVAIALEAALAVLDQQGLQVGVVLNANAPAGGGLPLFPADVLQVDRLRHTDRSGVDPIEPIGAKHPGVVAVDGQVRDVDARVDHHARVVRGRQIGVFEMEMVAGN